MKNIWGLLGTILALLLVDTLILGAILGAVMAK